MTDDTPAATAPALHAPPGFLAWVAVLVHAHRARLLGYARRRGLDADDALDAVQESFVSFLRLPEARGIARDSTDAAKLLTVVLRHNVANRRRKRARHAHALEALAAETPIRSGGGGGATSEELIASAEELARLHGCILRMARLQRRVVTLSLLDEQPRDAVAKVLGISDGHVRVLLHRAREHLRACDFEDDDDNAPRLSAAAEED